MRTHIQHRRIALATVLAGATLLAGACGDKSSSGDASTTTTGSSAKTAVSAPDTITIAYQEVPNGDLVVKHEKWLESAFPKSTIAWKKFESGGDVNEAVTAGAVDFGLVGSSPVSRGLSKQIPYEVPWIFDVIGKAEALVVRGSKVSSLADLKGKTVATPFASTAHYSLLAALDDAGIDPSSVKIIDAAPDEIYAAWTRGDIDGAYVWNPNLAKLKSEGGKVLVDSSQLAAKGKTTYDLAVVTSAFASKYPEAVTEWARQQNRAVELIRNKPDVAAKDVAAELNLTPAEATSQLADLIFLDASEQVGPDYLGGGLATNLIAAAKFNKSLGKIDSVQPDAAYESGVVSSFAKAAAKK